MHTYVEMAEGNHLCTLLKQTKISFSSLKKSENWKAEQVLPGGLVSVGGKRGVWKTSWKGEYGAIVVYTSK
jgi:hypothetical protein